MQIRTVANAADLEAAIRVAGAAQAPGDHMPPDDWRFDTIREAFPADADVDVIAVADGEVVGAALSFRDEGGVRVRVLGVDAAHRRSGVGTALMARLVENVRAAGDRRVYLGAGPDSSEYYPRLGFTVCGEHATGLVFEKILGPSRQRAGDLVGDEPGY